MKQVVKYITPLRITALVFLTLTTIYFIQIHRELDQGYNPGLGGLAPFATGVLMLGAVILDLILTIIVFKENGVKNFLTQLGILIVFFSWIYWPNWILNIEVPTELTGELLIVYEYEKSDKLPLALFGTGDRLQVPENGIIFTKSKFSSNYNNTNFYDASDVEWGNLDNDKSKFDLPAIDDSVNINGKKYYFQAIPIRNRPNADYRELESRLDSLKLYIQVKEKMLFVKSANE